MKTLLVALLSAMLITPVYADGWHEGGRRGGSGWGGEWILPALIGGAILYDATRPQTIYVEPPPVINVQPAPVYGGNLAPPVSQYWYYCAATNAYYPNVPDCRNGWQLIPATPAMSPPQAMPAPPRIAPSRSTDEEPEKY
jgi:hypothetical protein